MAQTTILVVDDSPFASKQIKDSVEGQGYQVIGYAQNGEEGIRMYEELHPDIVILDIIMPGIDGMESRNPIKNGSGRKNSYAEFFV